MTNTVLSFSGGKDSMFALHRMIEQGITVVCLMTTVWNESGETVAHGEKLKRLEDQAARLNIPIEWVVTDFENYTTDYKRRLEEIKETYQLDGIAFGDIYLEGHRKWGEELAQSVNLEAIYPLWTKKERSIDLLHDFVKTGYKSEIIKLDEEKLPKDWLGREIDQYFIEDIVKLDVCPLGESGEYHTYVYDGPLFQKNEFQS